MLTCKELTELATDYLEGNLPWRRRLGVRMHLLMCRYCRAYVEQIRIVSKLLSRLSSPPPSATTLEQLSARFKQTARTR